MNPGMAAIRGAKQWLPRLSLLTAIFLIAACARIPRANSSFDSKTGQTDSSWAGRISLQIASEPPQSFSGSFELSGRPERGELTLISPIGSVVSVLRWSPDEALLDSGNGKVQRFGSIDELMLRATGAVIPLPALFSWLGGSPANIAGWSADLARHAEGRVLAKRTEPAPEADLRVVLDRPSAP
jgi:outer membrane lipoprotein LolB